MLSQPWLVCNLSGPRNYRRPAFFKMISRIFLIIILLFFSYHSVFADKGNIREYQDVGKTKKKHFIDFKEAERRKFQLNTRPASKKSEANLKKTTHNLAPVPQDLLLESSELKDKSQKSEEDGTKIALKKELRRYSNELELYLLSSMWKFAYSSTKDIENRGIGDTLYTDQYIARMVEQAYGKEGGQLADALYEKLIADQGLDLEE